MRRVQDWGYLSVSLLLNGSVERFPSTPNLARGRRLHLLYHTRLQILQMWILQKKENGEGNIAGIASAGKTADSSVDSSANTRHACILVAEDTDSNFDLLEAILGKDHRLIRAHDGMEAVTMFDEVKPDLILMDIKMPNLDGLEAYKNHP